MVVGTRNMKSWILGPSLGVLLQIVIRVPFQISTLATVI